MLWILPIQIANMNKNNILKFIVSLGIPQLAGAIGSIFTISSIPVWYEALNRPELAPPNWVFGPVWTTLFLLMGIAVFLVLKKGSEKKGVKIALGVFAVQLVLNTLWSYIFFGLQSPGGAFIEIIFLWIAILANIIVFYRISKLAAYLLIPYIAWVSFAGYLNYMIWVLN